MFNVIYCVSRHRTMKSLAQLKSFSAFVGSIFSDIINLGVSKLNELLKMRRKKMWEIYAIFWFHKRQFTQSVRRIVLSRLFLFFIRALMHGRLAQLRTSIPH